MDLQTQLTQVKNQYEQLPYPPRDPEEETERLLITVGDHLLEMNHHCFQGRQDFDKFRCLVAGGGTGDSVIYLSEQLRHFSAEVVYLDWSNASMEIAKARALKRGLTQIEWRQGSLLDLPEMNLGKFDYINCSGVLHHLPDPEKGLASLRSVLSDNGAIFLMVYAAYGRYPINFMQRLFKSFIPTAWPLEKKIAVARKVLKTLPNDHLFNQVRSIWESEFEGYGDSGFYDLFLHAIDQSYSVERLYQLAENHQMSLVEFISKTKQYYDLDQLIKNPALRSLWVKKTRAEQHALAEKIYGQHIKHHVYFSKSKKSQATLADRDLALVLTRSLAGQHQVISEALSENESLALNFDNYGQTISVTIEGDPITQRCFDYMRPDCSIRNLIQHVQHDLPNTTEAQILKTLQVIYDTLFPYRQLYLCHPTFSGGLA